MRGSRIEYVKTMLGKFEKRLGIASHRTEKDKYFITRDGILVARIYKLRDRWYVWYEDYMYRRQVKNFTEGRLLLEKELLA